MPDDKRTSQVPTSELLAITQKLTEVAGGVKAMQETQLPQVAADAKEARDGVIKLTGWNRDIVRRVDSLETSDKEQGDDLDQQRASITAQERELAGLSKWRWWVMGVAVTLGLFAAGMAGRALYSQGEASTERNGLRRDVDRHEDGIETLDKTQRQSRDAIIRAVKAVPVEVQQKLPEPDIEDALDEQPLTKRERQFIDAVLDRAEKRNGVAATP